MKTETAKLKDILKKLRKQHGSDEIFKTLVSICNESSDDYLTDEVIMWMNLEKGLNVVKLDGLTQQMDFEEKMRNLFPFDNDRQTNLFLTN